ncbi:MAG: ABC transporter permease [Planctomycetota bacterium]|jgi:putative xylitol transport system permease protein|nr:ABC transporter permease [Planctomycetota bacterium]
MNGTSFNTRQFFQKYGIFLVFIVLCVVMSFLSNVFFTSMNIRNILMQVSINGILSIGMTFVIITGGIDLSVGSVTAMAGMVGASFVAGRHPGPLVAGIGMGLVAGILAGALSGFIIAKFRLPAFVVTLGMLSSARGYCQLYNNGMPIPNLSDEFLFIGQGHIYGIPMPVVIYLSLVVISWFCLRYSRYSRYVYAVGGNEKSARTSGVNTARIIFSVYLISGLCAGIASLILTARTTSALTQAGNGYELDAIAAVVVGGTSLSGGVGSVGGTFIGVLIIGVLNNGLDLLGVSSYWHQIIKGIVIVLAVLLDSFTSKRSNS